MQALDPQQERGRVRTGVEEENVPQNDDVEAPVGEYPLQQGEGEGRALNLGARSRQSRARQVQLRLFEEQSIRPGRSAGPDKVSDQGEREGDDGIDDEEPPPPCESVDAVQISRGGRLKKTGSQCAESKANIEYASAAADFITSIPASKNEMNTREIARLLIISFATGGRIRLLTSNRETKKR